jgi:hypothetical protein
MNDAIAPRPAWRLANADWRFFVSKETLGVSALRWTWRAVASNGSMWQGDEGFATRASCEADTGTHGYALT